MSSRRSSFSGVVEKVRGEKEGVGYDAQTCTLEVGLIKLIPPPKKKAKAAKGKAGTRRAPPRRQVVAYRYKDVPAEILTGILTAASAGLYFNEMIKPHYIGRRVP